MWDEKKEWVWEEFFIKLAPIALSVFHFHNPVQLLLPPHLFARPVTNPRSVGSPRENRRDITRVFAARKGVDLPP